MSEVLPQEARTEKVLRDEAARKRVLTNAATILGIPPSDLIDRAEIKEALAKVSDSHEEYLERVSAKSAEDQRIRDKDQYIRDELLYAVSSNLFTNREGMPILADARKAFKARFFPDWVKPKADGGKNSQQVEENGG